MNENPKPAGNQVLVVDDDSSIRETFRLILSLSGYEVSTAENGQEALNQLAEGARPNLILLDLMMPVMNGWQVLDSLKGNPELKSIPVVVVTAFPIHESERRVGLRVLNKPLDMSALTSVVQEYCG